MLKKIYLFKSNGEIAYTLITVMEGANYRLVKCPENDKEMGLINSCVYKDGLIDKTSFKYDTNVHFMMDDYTQLSIEGNRIGYAEDYSF